MSNNLHTYVRDDRSSAMFEGAIVSKSNEMKAHDKRIESIWRTQSDLDSSIASSKSAFVAQDVFWQIPAEKIQPVSSHTEDVMTKYKTKVVIPPLQIHKLMEKQKEETEDDNPWNSIRDVGNTHIQEILTDICRLSLIKYPDEKHKDIMSFCFGLMRESTSHESFSYSHPLMMTFGKVLFLMEKEPSLFLQMKHITKNQIQNMIDDSFERHFKPYIEELNTHYNKNQQNRVLSPDVILHHEIPLQIAKILFAHGATINSGLLEVVKQRFIKNPKHPINYEISLLHALNCLQHSAKLRAIIAFARKPASTNAPSNFVIRAALKLKHEEQITNEHARLTLLSAILAHDRQGQTNMCFAAHLAEALLSLYLLEVPAQDFSDMIFQSKLVRKVNDVEEDMPFLLKLSNESLNTVLELDKEGNIYHDLKTRGQIWDSSPMLCLSKVLGIEYTPDLKSRVLKHCFSSIGLSCQQINLGALIDEIVKVHCQIKELKNCGEMTGNAHFVVGSLLCNPVHKVWENCIAGMVEARSENYLRTCIVKSILTSFKDKIEYMENIPFKTKRFFYEHLKELLLDKIHLFYDPSLPGTSLTMNTHLSDGGFVLYEKKLAGHPETWLRVDNSIAFQDFVANIVENAEQKCLEEPGTIKTGKHWNVFIKDLKQFCQTPQFLSETMTAYSDFMPYVDKQSTDLDNLKCAPWKNKIGHDANMALQIYSEMNELPPISSIKPQSSSDLLHKIITLGRSTTIYQQLEYEENPHKLVPMRILNSHAFGLMLGHPSLKKSWTTTMPIYEWIKENITKKGDILMNTPMSSDLVKKVITSLKVQLNIRTESELELINDLKDLTWTFGSLRDRLTTVFRSYEKLTSYYDGYIATHLPPETDKIFKSTIIHFADTNWSDDVNDIHFCFLTNPCSGKLEIWEVNDDDSHPIPIQNQEGLINQQWDFLTDPEKLIKDRQDQNKAA